MGVVRALTVPRIPEALALGEGETDALALRVLFGVRDAVDEGDKETVGEAL